MLLPETEKPGVTKKESLGQNRLGARRWLEAFHVMAKPTGPICNLDCKYCFYLEKEKLYGGQAQWAMSESVLENYVRQYIAAQRVPVINFAWQGGEPTLLGVDFFRKVVALQKLYAGGKQITNAFQTNGVLLDDRWGGVSGRKPVSGGRFH